MNLVFRSLVSVLAALGMTVVAPLAGSMNNVVSSEAATEVQGTTQSNQNAPVMAENDLAHNVTSATDSPGLALAKKHLSELMPVLEHLQLHSTTQYEKAIRDLDRSAKKLESIKRRDAKLFDLSLREWKARGQVDLLKAKLRVKQSDADQQVMLQRLKALRDSELERVQRELTLIDERERAFEERIRQTQHLIDRGVAIRERLNSQKQQLETELIDKNSQVYLRAIGIRNNEGTRVEPASKSKSKRTTNE